MYLHIYRRPIQKIKSLGKMAWKILMSIYIYIYIYSCGIRFSLEDPSPSSY